MRTIAIALARVLPMVIVTAFLAQSSVPFPTAAAATRHAAAAEGFPGFEPTVPPATVPEIRFSDASGRALTLSDFRGKVVLLNFWATWCGPCVLEMPSLDRLQGLLGGSSFEVVALSLDRGGAAVVTPFFAKHGIVHLAQYLDTTTRSSAAFRVSGLPTSVLIDASGREIGRVEGPAEWDSDAIVAFLRRQIGTRPTTTTAEAAVAP
jgi:thiol-disulfide isomerase/thioredoxin